MTCIFSDNGYEVFVRESAEDFFYSDGSYFIRGFREGNEFCFVKYRRNVGRRAVMSEKLYNSGKLSEEGFSVFRYICIF